MMIKWLFSIVMMFLLSLSVFGQSVSQIYASEMLVYTKVNADNITFIMQRGDKEVVYHMPNGLCGKMSKDGRYLAMSSDEPDNIIIVHFYSQLEVFSMNWNTNWRICEFYWLEDNILALNTLNQDNVYFKLEDANLIPITISKEEYSIYPDLPNFLLTNLPPLILQSPANPNVYLYEKCPTGVIVGEIFCENFVSNVVVYNLLNQQELAILEDSSVDFMSGYRIARSTRGNTEDISAPLVAWSPDGRYVAYFHSKDSNIWGEGEFIVYDLQMDRYIRGANELQFPNIWWNIQWSDENVLLIPRAGLFSDIYNFEFYDSLTLFSFLHADSETYATATVLFDSLSNPIFAPDSRSIAFIGSERVIPEQQPTFYDEYPYRADLILISTTTGEHTVIDTDVSQIITWRSVCDFTVSDTASLISTMQTEPYSVICLDENGQYDLTAPLPDVSGDITIIGNGATIMMTGQNRILNVVYNQQWSRNGSLTLKNVALLGGVADEGGAIYNAGDLTLEDVTLQNHSAVRGGAIYNGGNLVMNGGAIQNNSASEFGGGIYNIGDMQLDGVDIRDNNAPEGGGVYQGG